jgi:rare lipoprotein A
MTLASKTLAVVAVLLGSTCAAISGAEAKSIQSGRASWYGPGFHGKKTASGECFNTRALTAAHRSLPFGTKVLVTNERTGRSVVVRINDRGPFAHGRVIDLSKAAAQAVGISGVGKVKLARL